MSGLRQWAAPEAPAPITATVVVPGSKSETNRALILAALADGPSVIRGGLEARDTQLMRDALRTSAWTSSKKRSVADPPPGVCRWWHRRLRSCRDGDALCSSDRRPS